MRRGSSLDVTVGPARMAGASVALLACIWFAACTSLSPIEEQVCGNLVTEPAVGEECDTFSVAGPGTQCGAAGTPNACKFVCASSVVCPDGWFCGGDGRCRVPSGQFSLPQSWSFDAERFAVGDLDGDGRPDLVGDRPGVVIARYADTAGFGELTTFQVPISTDIPHYTTLDADSRLDALVPLDIGLFTLRGRPERVLGPIAYPERTLDPAVPTLLLPLESDGNRAGTEVLTLSGTQMRFENLSGGAQGGPIPLPAPQRDVSDILGRVPTVDLDIDDGRTEFALAFRDSARMWIYRASGSASQLDLQVTLTATTTLPGEVTRGARFADVNGDGHPDLIAAVRDAQAGERRSIAYFNPQRGGFDTACLVDFVDERGRAIEWALALGDIDGNRRVDLVTPDGVYANSSDDTTPRCNEIRFTRRWGNLGPPWREAAFGDFNGDGRNDLAAVPVTGPRVVFLLGDGRGQFTDFVRSLSRPAALLRPSDYDGDFVTDLAVSTMSSSDRDDEVVVLFGQASGGPSAPISMGNLGRIERLEPMDAVRAEAANDQAKDLFVVSEVLGQRTTTVLFGNSERRMVAPLILLRDDRSADTPVSVTSGNFCRSCEDEASCLDAEDVASVSVDASGTPNLWFLPGRADRPPGTLTVSESNALPLPERDSFGYDCATWIANDVNGSGFDDVIAIDGVARCSGEAMTARPSRLLEVSVLLAGSRCTQPYETNVRPLPMTLARLSSARFGRLDDDEFDDLLLAFAGNRQNDTYSAAGIVVVFGGPSGLSFDEVITLSWPVPVRDIRAASIDSDVGKELLIAASTEEISALDGQGVFAIEMNGRNFSDARQLVDEIGLEQVEAVDIDADGLLDLVYSDGERIEATYAVPEALPEVRRTP